MEKLLYLPGTCTFILEKGLTASIKSTIFVVFAYGNLYGYFFILGRRIESVMTYGNSTDIPSEPIFAE
jgi:hypothetical protein